MTFLSGTFRKHPRLAPARRIHVAAASLTLAPIAAQAASRSDAPLIKQDPQTNSTDVYAVIGAKATDLAVTFLNVLITVHPFSEPGDGVIFDRFSDDVLSASTSPTPPRADHCCSTTSSSRTQTPPAARESRIPIRSSPTAWAMRSAPSLTPATHARILCKPFA